MKKLLFLFSVLSIFVLVLSSFKKEKHCVFRTVMNEDPVENKLVINNPSTLSNSIDAGLEWLKNAQQLNGGWGAGLHSQQKNQNPHAVNTDAATTAMVAMALMRSGSSLDDGPYHKELTKATNHLISEVEKMDKNNNTLVTHGQTQIQSKLGQNIDLVMTTQYFTNLAKSLPDDHEMKQRIENLLQKCVESIEVNIADNGSLNGGTWAGVLQSSYANSALESAKDAGVVVDEVKLTASRKYQTDNYNPSTEESSTADGAGIMLYAVSGSTRANAKKAKDARQTLEQAIKRGMIKEDRAIDTKAFMDAGLSEAEAMEYNTAYQVYNSGKIKSQRKEVMKGYGNNGGEEFLSYLQTGESLIVNEDESWSNWYDNIAKTILDIQNEDGSWNGHHCITSPVFCTATCISLLTINNDIEAIRSSEE